MNTIQHHGILGQKWGIQNGPPYPLDYNDHSAAEKRAMKKDARDIQKQLNRNEEKYVQAKLNANYSAIDAKKKAMA